MQDKFLEELIFARIHAEPVFALARIQENILEESFSAYLPNSWGNAFRCEYMPRLYSHPREYRTNIPGDLCMYWFRARGNRFGADSNVLRHLITKGVKVLETAAGALFALTSFSLVRISFRDLAANRNP